MAEKKKSNRMQLLRCLRDQSSEKNTFSAFLFNENCRGLRLLRNDKTILFMIILVLPH